MRHRTLTAIRKAQKGADQRGQIKKPISAHEGISTRDLDKLTTNFVDFSLNLPPLFELSNMESNDLKKLIAKGKFWLYIYSLLREFLKLVIEKNGS